jgi:hypothetical protein
MFELISHCSYNLGLALLLAQLGKKLSSQIGIVVCGRRGLYEFGDLTKLWTLIKIQPTLQ